MTRFITTAVLILAAALAGQAQSQAPPEPQWQIDVGSKMAFDVASVKQNKSAGPDYRASSNFPLGLGDSYSPNGGLFSATNYPVSIYIGFAYKLTPYQRRALDATLPKWAKDKRFDIEARAAANATKDQMRFMMRNLLAQRFKLTVHGETRQGPVFALVLVKPGEAGPKLRLHSNDSETCGAFTTSAAARTPAGIPSSCDVFLTLVDNGRTQTSAQNVSLETIANFLPFNGMGSFDRPVVDRTGLSGLYDFTVDYMPETTAAPNAQSSDAEGTYLEALRDQLGLKLKSTTGPIETLVVDHIEEPTPN